NFFNSTTNQGPFVPVPPGATNPIFNTNIFLNRTNFFLNPTDFFPGTKTPFNSDNPSTFPQQAAITNFNPVMMTNSAPSASAPSTPARNNSSPFNSPFNGSSDFAGLPAPVTGNSPWSPQ